MNKKSPVSALRNIRTIASIFGGIIGIIVIGGSLYVGILEKNLVNMGMFSFLVLTTVYLTYSEIYKEFKD